MKITGLMFCIVLAFQDTSTQKTVYEAISEAGEVAEIRVYLPSPTEVSYHGSSKERIEFLLENYSLLVTMRVTQMTVFALEATDKSRGKPCDGMDQKLADSVVQIEYKSGVVGQYVVVENTMISVGDSRCYPLPNFIEKVINLSL